MNWWRHRYTWALASFAAVLVGNLGGLAIGDDGVGYQAVSDNLRAGRGLGYFIEPKLTIWPPGWPALMALVSKITTLNSEGSAILLNAITAAVIVILVNRILTRLLRSDQLVLIGTAVASIGASPMVFGHLLMTDFAFAAVTLGVMLALLNFRETPTLGWLSAAAGLVWLGFLIRYAGVITIITGTGWLVLAPGPQPTRPMGRRIRDAVSFGVAASVVPVAWMLRNLSVDDTLLGVRYSSARGLIPNTFDTVATIGNFLVPGVAIDLRTVWAAVAVLGTAVMGAMLWRVARTEPRFTSAAGVLGLFGSAPGLFATHALVYLTYMLYVRTTTGLNQLDFRLLNPAYLPLVFVGLVILDRVITASDPGPSNPDAADPPASGWVNAAKGLAGAWGVASIAVGVAMVVYFSTSPDLFVGNYERPAFVEARDSAALTNLDAACSLSSNAPNALYAGGIEAEWSPRITGPESNDPVDDFERLKADLAKNRRHCLVWIDLEPTWGHLATLSQLREEFTLVKLGSDKLVTTFEFREKS